ncbi:hypothetical protein ACJ73_09529 [Blastomyces percursus]|uniref:Uncharacterized protein n=1 Tax=Blastomyces percursus TaxID=1658174 RepID=A0A1J9P5R4_9EURO|nr:hypothetical protein ACJ73_09529 [Blastomyces percursus]
MWKKAVEDLIKKFRNLHAMEEEQDTPTKHPSPNEARMVVEDVAGCRHHQVQTIKAYVEGLLADRYMNKSNKREAIYADLLENNTYLCEVLSTDQVTGLYHGGGQHGLACDPLTKRYFGDPRTSEVPVCPILIAATMVYYAITDMSRTMGRMEEKDLRFDGRWLTEDMFNRLVTSWSNNCESRQRGLAGIILTRVWKVSGFIEDNKTSEGIEEDPNADTVDDLDLNEIASFE